jgi:ferritin-like protein
MEFKVFEESGGYKYLLQMTMESVSHEHVESLIENTRKLRQKHEELMAKNIEDIWIEELTDFENEYKRVSKSKTLGDEPPKKRKAIIKKI